MVRFRQGRDSHGRRSNLGANMVTTRPVQGTEEGVLAAGWKDVEHRLGPGLGMDSKSKTIHTLGWQQL